MRHLLSLAAVAVICFNGCRSCTTMPAPIVGDSMSHWGATENSTQCCQAQTVDFRNALSRLTGGLQTGAPCRGSNKFDDFGGPQCCGNGPMMMAPMPCGPTPMGMAGMGGMPYGVGGPSGFGCGGQGCAGLCGGRCAAARSMAQARRGSNQEGAHELKLPHPMANAHRACAYGKCGARPGPERGAVSFPYYTVRGPRDFLAADPPSIGP